MVVSSVIYVALGAGGVVVAVDGAVTAQALPVIFGTLWAVGWGYIYWRLFHLASRLEFTGGCLSWRGSMAWSPAMRPGRVKAIRWPASRRSEHVGIELDDGRKVAVRPGLGLMEFIHRVQEADPAIDVDVRPSGQAAIRMDMEPSGFTEQRGLVGGNNRAFRRSFSIVMVLALLVAAVEAGLTLTGPQKNFHTLRSDLARVHLPAGYRLIATRQAGTDCSEQCSLTQTWAWAPSSTRTSSAACTDVDNALSSAWSGVDSNSPMPADAACDYYAIAGSFFHPGQGKRTVEAIVRTGQAGINDSFLIEVSDSYTP